MRAAATQKLLSTLLEPPPARWLFSCQVSNPPTFASSLPRPTDRIRHDDAPTASPAFMPSATHQRPSASSPPYRSTSTRSSGLRLPTFNRHPANQTCASACMRPAATAPRSPDLGLWDEHIEQERAGPQSLTWSLIECHCARSAGQGSDLSAVTALRGAEGSS